MEDWQVISPDQFMDGPSPVMTGDYDSRSSGELTVHRYNCQVSYVWAADALLRYQVRPMSNCSMETLDVQHKIKR